MSWAVSAPKVLRSVSEVPRDKTNSIVRMYFKVKGTSKIAKVSFELFDKIAPKTVDNFRSLASGECGIGSHGKQLTYKLSTIHKVVPGFFLQGGDIMNCNGSGGWSIYGPSFPDENLDFKFDQPGILAMANTGPNTNNSQFFVSLAPMPWLDGKHVVFGRVIQGMYYLNFIQNVCRPDAVTGAPRLRVIIDRCHVAKKE